MKPPTNLRIKFLKFSRKKETWRSNTKTKFDITNHYWNRSQRSLTQMIFQAISKAFFPQQLQKVNKFNN